MATTTTLEKVFKKEKLPKFFKINFQVEGYLGSKKMTIRDGSTGMFSLELLDVKPASLKYFDIGKFVKVINPIVRKDDFTLLVNGMTIVCLGEPIAGLEVALPFLPISATYDYENQVEVPGKILAKVVRIYDPLGPYQSQGGPRCKHACQIKDVDGSRQTLKMWYGVKTPFENEKTFVFSNLRADRYNGKTTLICESATCIQPAAKEHEEALKGIAYHDGNFKGKVLAINAIKLFKSCIKCQRSIRDEYVIKHFSKGMACPKCKQGIEEIVDDFSFHLVIAIGSEYSTFVAFRKTISFEGPSTVEDEVEQMITSQLEGKSMEGTFISSRSGDEYTIQNLAIINN